MKELKITVDQLKNYLGTGLKVTFDGDEYEHELVGIDLSNEGMHLISVFNDFGRASIKNTRPLVYRLSDLDKEIEHNGERFVPELQMMEIWSRYHNDSIKSMYQLQVHETELYRVYHDLKKLFEWHFWPFGEEYFEKGLVIDKMKHNV